MRYMEFKRLQQRKTFLITKDGLDHLRRRLEAIMKERFAAIKRIRSMDRRDDAAQLALTDEIIKLEAAELEAQQIDNILQRAEPIVKPSNPTHVQVGCLVTVEAKGRRSAYTIVYSFEADPLEDKISEESPMGQALLNKRLGDTVSVLTQRGEERLYKIVDIK